MTTTPPSLNYLTPGQRRIYESIKNLDDAKTILNGDAATKQQYFAHASSFSTLSEKKAAIVKLTTDAVTLTKCLFDASIYENGLAGNTISTKVSTLCDTVNGVLKTLENVTDEGTLNTFTTNLDGCFPVDKNLDTAIEQMTSYGIFSGTYKKVIAMLRNYNPFSRIYKQKKTRVPLGEPDNKDVPTEPRTSILAQTKSDENDNKRDSKWIFGHLNSSLPVCCIDKLIYLVMDTSVIHTKLSKYVKQINQLNPVIGGGLLSYFTFISFYYLSNASSGLSNAQKLRLKVIKGKEGGFHIESVVYPERLNIQNELKRAAKSADDGTETSRVYNVYYTNGTQVTKVDKNTKNETVGSAFLANSAALNKINPK